MIKKILVAFIFTLSSFVSNSSIINDNENFTMIGKTEIFTSFVNPDSIKQKNDILFAKSISVLYKDQSNIIPNKLIKSIVKFSRYDCKKQQMKIDLTLFLDSNFELIELDEKSSDWFQLEKNTIGFLELLFVCNKIQNYWI